MDKNKCVSLFNLFNEGKSVSFNDDLIPLISDYLTDINYKNSKEIISLIIQNPQLAVQCIPTILEYYTRKYTIFSIKYDGKILLYYV
jgi:hypothetical protein